MTMNTSTETELRTLGAAHRAAFQHMCFVGALAPAFDALGDRTVKAVEAVCLAGGVTPAFLHGLRPKGKRALRVWNAEVGEVLGIAQGARVRANPKAMSFWGE